jgi:HEAT repeat protein
MRISMLVGITIVLAASGAAILSLGCSSSFGSVEDKWAKALADLRNTDVKVRRLAAELLVDIALECRDIKRTAEETATIRKHIRTLADVIHNKEEDAQVRASLVHALAIGEFGALAQHVVPSLIEVLLDETDQEIVRGWISMVLPDIGPPERVGPAIIAATKSRNTVVQVNASQQLGRVALDADTLLALLNKAMDDPTVQVRVAAVSHATILAKTDKRAVLVLVRATSDRDKVVQQVAVSLAKELDSDAKDVEPELVKLLSSPDPSIRVHSAVALTRISAEGSKYISIAIEALQAKEASIRGSAALALITSGPEAKAAVPALTERLRDDDDKVRVLSAGALASITGKAEDYLATFVAGLASEDEEARIWASRLLGLAAHQAKSAAQPLLLQAIKHDKSFVRSVALSILAGIELDRATALDVFSSALGDQEAAVRIAALLALEQMGRAAEPAIPKVQAALRDSNKDVQKIAQQTLRKITQDE